MLDIWHDKDIQKISEAMKSEPEMSIHPASGSERCLWVRQ
jgi:hypothetical protein